MSRAMVAFDRTGDGGWTPVVAWLGTTSRLDARALPGSGERDAFVNAMLEQAVRPFRDSEERGTWEDWIGWAVDALSNGHDMWMVEVKPELTIDALYEREILQTEPTSPALRPEITPADAIPESLEGYRRVRPG